MDWEAAAPPESANPPLPPADIFGDAAPQLAARMHPATGGLEVPVPPANGETESDSDHERDHEESEDEIRSQHDDESEEDEPARPWQEIPEDKSVPCEDEMKYIESKGEHSALDHEYWEQKTFLHLDDPEMVPGESGRIDWLVEAFNGTKDKPNSEIIMRSPIVRIGGLDWQIKLYPKGNNSYCLSVYVECVSMLGNDYASSESFDRPPFPFLKATGHERRRCSQAAQLSVVVYNPAEPRVYDYRIEAHQFHKRDADYGWRYFNQHSQSPIHIREHAQRQAMLRNDKLAFKAYIRLVDDPTRNEWVHRQPSPEDMISVTGLRPFRKYLQHICGVVPLLHFAPFRRLVQELPPDTQLARWLQPLLLKMFTRQLSSTYNGRVTPREGDVMEALSKLSSLFYSENDPALVQQWEDILGAFHAGRGAACGLNRLDTKDHTCIQDAVNSHRRTIARVQLLTLELTRQDHDKKTRKWKKLTKKVHLDENIQIEGTGYTLFAFITHDGPLMGSSRYKSYVRPNGPNNGWYCYGDGLVRRLTEKQARDRHSGSSSTKGDRLNALYDKDSPKGRDSPFSYVKHEHESESEVVTIAMYARNDAKTFDAPFEETWVPPFLNLSGKTIDTKKLTTVELTSALTSESFERAAGSSGLNAEKTVEGNDVDIVSAMHLETNAATPEPTTADFEDTIMRDVDQDIHSIEAPGTNATVQGTFSWFGRCHYDGTWMNGKYHGGGHLIDTNGDEYLGEFKDGLKHGYGKMIYASNGDIYSGMWLNGQHHGLGVYTELSSGNVYDGGWMKGRRHGQFTLTGTFTEEEKCLCTICYEEELSTAFDPCGHIIACQGCARLIRECPICRRPVQSRLLLYGVKFSMS